VWSLSLVTTTTEDRNCVREQVVGTSLSLSKLSLSPLTLDSKLKKIVSVMNMLLIYFLASMKLEKRHIKLFGSSFKIMLHHDILPNMLKYYKEWWFK